MGRLFGGKSTPQGRESYHKGGFIIGLPPYPELSGAQFSRYCRPMSDLPININYGKTIARLRDIRGWTRAKLAEKAGFDENTIYKIEIAEIGITANNLERISSAFDVHPSELFIADNDAVRVASAKLVKLSGGDLEWLLRLISVLEEKISPADEDEN